MSHRRAMTLVELLIALVLSVMIILVATATIRVVVRSVQRVQQLAVENELLRLGVEAVLVDADFGHSEADVADPYRKGWRREGPLSHPYQIVKRPYERLRFSPGTDPDAVHFADPTVPSALVRTPNPNALLPHDARSWYRGWWWVDDRSQSKASDLRVRIHGDYSLVTATDMRGPRHLEGTAAGGGSWPAGTRLIAEDRADLGQHLPLLQAATWSELGSFGPVFYAPRGVGPVPMDQHGNRYQNETHNRPHNITYYQRGYQSSPLPRRRIGGRGDGHRYALPMVYQHFATDVVSGFGKLLGHGVGMLAMKPSNRQAVVATVGGDQYRIGNFDWHYGTQDAAVNTGPSLRDMSRLGDLLRNQDYLSETIRLPYNVTDAAVEGVPIDYETLPAGYPVMSTAIARYHAFVGGQLALCRVSLVPAGGGEPVELSFTPLTSDYRALRQHWRLVPVPAGEPEAGDWYE